MEGIQYKDYLNMINDISYIELHKYYTQETFLDILNVARQENPHSSFLRWLFDSNSSHGLGVLPLQKLLQTVCLAKEKMYEDVNQQWWIENRNLLASSNSSYFDAIKYGRYKISDVRVANEVILSSQRRADIFVACKIQFETVGEEKNLIILIENKVKSSENKSQYESNSAQTEKYAQDIFSMQGKNSPVHCAVMKLYEDNIEGGWDEPLALCIYLNAFKNKEIKGSPKNEKINAVLATSKEFITINYQYLMDGVLEPAYHTCQNQLEKIRLEEYIRCLGQSRLEEGNDNYLIMALSSKEKEFAIKLWDGYKNIILKIFQMLRSEEDFGFDQKEIPFWKALANVYMILFEGIHGKDESERQEYEELAKMLNTTKKSSRIHVYEYKRIKTQETSTYRSFTKNSIGMLCRDIIEDVIISQKLDKRDVEEFRKELQKFKANWLREVILFEDEVNMLKGISYPNYSENNFKYPDGVQKKGEYKTHSIEEFSYSFFSYIFDERKRNKTFLPTDYDCKVNDDNAISLVDGSKIYVAKFWGKDDLEKTS